MDGLRILEHWTKEIVTFNTLWFVWQNRRIQKTKVDEELKIQYNLPEKVATISGCSSFMIPRRRLYSPAGLKICNTACHWHTKFSTNHIYDKTGNYINIYDLARTSKEELTSPLGSSNLAWRNNWWMRTICCGVRDWTGIFGLKSGPISPRKWKNFRFYL